MISDKVAACIGQTVAFNGHTSILQALKIASEKADSQLLAVVLYM